MNACVFHRNDPARVLIADEDESTRTLIAEALTSAGHEVVAQATCGADAVALYDATHPDVLTLGAKMPHTDAFATLSEIRARDPGAVVVMCSATRQAGVVVEALRRGASDFVYKPIESDQLINVVRWAVAGARSQELARTV